MYEVPLEPPVKIGENICVLTTEGKKIYYEVTYIEPLPPSPNLVKDFGALTAGSSSGDTKLDILEVDDDEVGIYRFFPLDDVECTLKLPKALRRFLTKTKTAVVTPLTRVYALNGHDPTLVMTEFAVFEDDVPYMDVKNPTNDNITMSRVQFYGWRLCGRRLDKKPEKVSYVVASGKGGA